MDHTNGNPAAGYRGAPERCPWWADASEHSGEDGLQQVIAARLHRRFGISPSHARLIATLAGIGGNDTWEPLGGVVGRVLVGLAQRVSP